MASRNFAESTVVTPPSPATSGLSLTVSTGQGPWFSAGPAAVWPPAVDPTPANAEVVTVLSIAGDVLTLSARAAESSTAKSIATGWQIAQGLTASTFDALLSAVAAKADRSGAVYTGAHDFTGATVTGVSTGGTVGDASTGGKGIVQLANHLAGTASAPQVVATALTAPLPLAQGGTGGGTATAARSALGLGGAATLNVGQSTGSVAAGDDTRITGALSAADATAAYGPGSPQWLKALAGSFGFAFTSITTTDTLTGLPTAGAVRWPDTTTGAFTGTVDGAGNGYSGWTVTWVGGTTKTVTASGVTYDSVGNPIGPTSLDVS